VKEGRGSNGALTLTRLRAERGIIMTTTNLKDVDYIKPWAIFFALTFVGGVIIGLVVGGGVGGILRAIGASPRIIAVFTGGLSFLVSMPISYFCFRFAVKKFLLPKITTPEATVVPLKAAA
jgi:hypothetical protein